MMHSEDIYLKGMQTLLKRVVCTWNSYMETVIKETHYYGSVFVQLKINDY